MNDKLKNWMIGGIFIVLVAALFLTIGQRQMVLISDSGEKISVSSTAEISAMPDQAKIQLTVFTEGRDPKTLQDQNSKEMNRVIAALKDAGVKEEEIETTNYNLYPWQEYDYQLQKTVDKGYRIQNTITVTTKTIDQVGSLLSTAVQSGVNEVNNIAFSLSDVKEKEVKDELIAQASAKAKDKAQALASNMEVRLGKVKFITESSYTPGIYYGRYDKALMTESAPAPTINPEQVQVSLTVNVDYAIK